MFPWKFFLIILEVILFASGYPIDPEDVPTPANPITFITIGIVFFLAFVFAVFACACCKERRDGFKEFTNPGSLTNVGFTNALATEVSIFPPPGSGESRPNVVPVTVSNTEQLSRPAAFSSTIPDVSDWFADSNANFPRQQLFYQKEIGKGWFGKVVEGEARGSKVVVRILREDATNEEKAYFLHEARPYRDLVHKNVTKLFGRCLQYEPYLLLFELYSNGDLKSFLLSNEPSRSEINEQGISLKLMIDVCEGIRHMNENGFIHTDLAARNCLVTSDLTVKIGDYGTSIDMYKNEYYVAGNVAVPIRWCAPETLHCTSTTIETKQVTASANVWSLAVVLWEIAEFGKLPYFDLTDDQVIIRVHGEEKYRLSQPDCPYGTYLFNIMQICWRGENRATIEQVLSMLYYLKTNPYQESDFESRWKKLKPNTVAIVDNHTPIHSPRHTELAQRPYLQTKTEFDSGVDLEIKPTDDNSCKNSSPMTISPQLSVTSEDIFHSTRKKSPSLTNLQGSLEDVSSQFDSWLQGVETKTDEDRTFAKNISEAIKNLDETLAMEKTSSSSSRDSSLECQNKPLLEFNIGAESGVPLERKSDSSSDTEEETWRHRIERGEFTEKVKEKSKSVTDLMVLTHIDSEDSESDSLPSLTRQYSLKKNGSKGATYTSIGFGSEGNIRNAVLSEELQDKLKTLALWKTEDQSFLGKRASDTLNRKNSNELSVGSSTVKKQTTLANSEVTKIFLEKEISASGISEKNSFLENNLKNTVHSVRGERMYSEDNEDNLGVNKICNVYNEISVNTSEIVNKVCTEVVNEKGNSCETTGNGNVEDLMKSNSSHERDEVPKIVITESELSPTEDEYEQESEIHFDFKPRKFTFICKDTNDCIEGTADIAGNDLVASTQQDDEEEIWSATNCVKSESTVILGSCEDYTLDYFKGLKTTFSPTEQFSDEESDLKESSSIKEDTVRQLTDTNEDCPSPSRDDSTAHVTDDCISPLKDDGMKYIADFILEDPPPPILDEVELSAVEMYEQSPTLDTPVSEQAITENSNVVPEDNYRELLTIPASLECLQFSIYKQCVTICDKFIKEELEYYRNNGNELKEEVVKEDLEIGNGRVGVLAVEKGSCTQKEEIVTVKPEVLVDNYQNLEPISKLKHNDSVVNNKQMYRSMSQNENDITKVMNCNFKTVPVNHVSKSKSLESILCNKNETETMRFLSNNSISDYVPTFSLSDIIPEEIFPKQSLNYDSYYSVDSGHGSDRCGDQDRQMDDLKTRLEDVVKYGEDYQLHSSEDEYGGKLLTPDDERSSDSGFRDKGSLSESVEDTCDEKYNLEDIDAELEDFNALKVTDKEDIRYYEQYAHVENESIPPPVQSMDGWFLHPKVEVDTEQNGWVSLSTENEEKHSPEIDDEFVTAIRNELKEKLPCAMQTQKMEEDNSPEQEFVDPNLQFNYPAQLSPILEEQESNQSSLLVDDISPILLLPPPEIPSESTEDINEILDSMVTVDEGNFVVDEGREFMLSNDDDVIMVDTETNEVTLIESPKPPSSHLTFLMPRKGNDNVIDDDSTGLHSETYVLSQDNAPLTPDMSIGSNTLSSPEHGISGMCISPSSVRSDLFDSGPPSLPFDLGQSLEEVEELSLSKPTNENSEIMKDLIDAGVVKNHNDCEEMSKYKEVTLTEKLEQDIENDRKVEASLSDVFITEFEPISSENVISRVHSFLEAERNNDMYVNTTLGSPDKSENKAQPLEVESSGENGAPVIVVEEEITNETEDLIDTEIKTTKEEPNLKPDDIIIDLKPFSASEQSKWLQELLLPQKNDKVVPVDDKLSVSQNWPSNDELISPTTVEEKSITLRPANITSTLALMSPDLSSTDSRSHSLLSSFASTPSDDQKLFGDESVSKISAPSSLSISSTIINVPMPSPEDAEKGWRPTICQLMELTDQADGEEMTTSFIEPDENGIYTPEWESDTSDEQSSSSGEFVWKEGDREDIDKDVSSDATNLLQEPQKMEIIEEEEENAGEGSESDDNSSEGSGTEFVPSTWNASATPSKSAIKSPETSLKSEKKKVIFKKEKYQCIYEYPREPSDDEDSPDAWQTPSLSFDYSPFTDWEFGDNEVGGATTAEGDSDTEDQRKPKKNSDFDFYRLDYNIGPHMITDDGEFFISSSSQVLDWCGGEDDPTDSSEFFPGRDSLDFSPSACDLTPLNLGELRHTKDSLRLELPLIARAAAAAAGEGETGSDGPADVAATDQTNSTAADSGIDTASPVQQQQQQQQQSTSSQLTQMSCAQQSAREDKGEAALLDEQPLLPSNK